MANHYLSTLEHIFLGNRNLFRTLFISNTDYDWLQYPVIHLSFSALSSKTAEHLEKDIEWKLHEIADSYAINISDAPSIQTKFEALIKRLSRNNKVVVLVDEYDYPLLNNIHDLTVAESCRKVMHDFFAILKDVGEYLRFIFITGVTKFSKTSIFSGLNNLDDLTLSRRAAQLLGYTEQELAFYFQPHIESLSTNYGTSTKDIIRDIRIWYDGYQFVEQNPIDQKNSLKVYNPFSVLAYLREGKLLNYWFESGTPTFLVYLIKTQEYPISKISGSEVNVEEVKAYEVDKIKLIPLLWQTGYLTIESYNSLSKNYKLTYPNEEVRTSFLHFFMNNLTDTQISYITSNS